MTLEQATAQIRLPDANARAAARRRLDTRAKLPGSLGRLEDAIVGLAGMQRTAFPRLNNKLVVVVCADNGVTAEGISPSDPSVTAAQAMNFARGGGTINAFARRLGAPVRVVDVGIATPYAPEGVERRVVRRGTGNMTAGPAMSAEECRQAVETGIDLAKEAAADGVQLLIPGEMGIGNTTSSSAVASVLLQMPPEEIAARGAGAPERVAHKADVIRRALERNQPCSSDPLDVLAKVGGLDIAALCGLYIGAASCGIAAMLDGIISCAAALAAVRLAPAVREYLLPSHCSAERAGALLLEALDMKPLITAGLCLGEGTGGVLGAALLDYALAAYEQVVGIDDI